MATTTRYYSYDDVGAPVINGTAGSLIDALRTMLVGTAGVAYGSKASAGWTEPFSASGNTTAFRNDSTKGTGAYLYVDDSGPGSGGAREARAWMYKTMSALGTGTVPVPNATQSSVGVVVRKSSTLDSTARPWFMVADELTAYMFINDVGTAFYAPPPLSATSFHCGDYVTFLAGDTYNYCIGARKVESSTSGNTSGAIGMAWSLTSAPTYPPYVGLSPSGVSDSYYSALLVPGTTNAVGGSYAATYPMPVTGENAFAVPYICAQAALVGRYRGLVAPLNRWDNVAGLKSGDAIPFVTGRPIDSVLRYFPTFSSSNAQTAMFVESVSEWV